MLAFHTQRVLAIGLVTGFMLNLPYISWMNGYGWMWTYGFPLGWFGAGLTAMSTFFHEIGHTVLAWYYGYVTIPSFDVTYGGGMAWMMTNQTVPLILCLYAAIIYGLYRFQEYRVLQIGLVLLLVFNLATAFNDVHRDMIDFMGPGFESILATFFLVRAALDLAPRGAVERYLNSIIGWGMLVKVGLSAHGLLTNAAMRENYYNQKGTHGFGDFDKIADRFNCGFEAVVWAWIAFTALCAAIGIAYILHESRRRDESLEG